MLLLIDAGNTRIKWAAIAADTPTLGAWAASGALAHADAAGLAQTWRALAITQVFIANVAGAAVQERLTQMLSRAADALPLTWFRSTANAAGLSNAYRDPGQLGCDRFAAAIGAHALYPDQALIIANCGTATTIDAVSADGVFVGGWILPGLTLMAQSLSRNTAQLPQIKQNKAIKTTFADNTDDAILLGCNTAQSASIQHAVALHTKQQGSTTCILSGGAAAAIAPTLAIPHQIVDNLVLIGLQTFANWRQINKAVDNQVNNAVNNIE